MDFDRARWSRSQLAGPAVIAVAWAWRFRSRPRSPRTASRTSNGLARRFGHRLGSLPDRGESGDLGSERARAGIDPSAAIEALRAKVAQVDSFSPTAASPRTPSRGRRSRSPRSSSAFGPASRSLRSGRCPPGGSARRSRSRRLRSTRSARSRRRWETSSPRARIVSLPHPVPLDAADGSQVAALRLAVADARKRAGTVAEGLGSRLSTVQRTSLGVYQITPRNSTEVATTASTTSRRASRTWRPWST